MDIGEQKRVIEVEPEPVEVPSETEVPAAPAEPAPLEPVPAA